MSLTIQGDQALIRKLRAIAGAPAKKIVRQAARSALRPVHFAARQNVPEDTGAIRKSIKLRSAKRSRKSVGARIVVDKGYAWILEKGGKTRPGYKAQPYIKPAIDHNKEQAFAIFKREVINGLLAVARRGG